MEHLQSIPANEPLVIVATGKYVGEGFDFPRLDTLMLAIPVSWKGIVAQYAGRLHRNYPNKHEVRIYDYVDIHVPLCELMYRRRMKGYAAIGYKTKLQPVNQGLFAELEEPEMSTPFFDGKSYSAAFRKDLAQANRSVIIACPNIHLQPHSPYYRLLAELTARGVQVTIYTKSDDSDHTNEKHPRFSKNNKDITALENIGVTIVLSPSLSCRCAIIDKKLIWYGSINFLGKNSVEDNSMRFEDSTLAADLLDIICSQ
jgi:phosphatidylserine/phosphatidylglycerophosphate/cardiolipin synthase-like enzyme